MKEERFHSILIRKGGGKIGNARNLEGGGGTAMGEKRCIFLSTKEKREGGGGSIPSWKEKDFQVQKKGGRIPPFVGGKEEKKIYTLERKREKKKKILEEERRSNFCLGRRKGRGHTTCLKRRGEGV